VFHRYNYLTLSLVREKKIGIADTKLCVSNTIWVEKTIYERYRKKEEKQKRKTKDLVER